MFLHHLFNLRMGWVTFVTVALLFQSACSPSPKIEDFDSTAWIKDVNGCEGMRKELCPILEPQRKKLKGLSETELVTVLGKPNKVQIMERQQKYFFYTIQDPVQCHRTEWEHVELKIRFGATNKVTEVLF